MYLGDSNKPDAFVATGDVLKTDLYSWSMPLYMYEVASHILICDESTV